MDPKASNQQVTVSHSNSVDENFPNDDNVVPSHREVTIQDATTASPTFPRRAIQSVSKFAAETVFPRMLIFSLIRLGIYLNKLYQDFGATYEYKDSRDNNFFAISVVSLLSPPVFYALFRIIDYLSKYDEVDGKEIINRTVNGILLIPLQIKRLCDILDLASRRVGYFRPPNEEEKQNLRQLQMLAEVLEFFEDFYSGFLQILLQVYIFLGTVDWIDSHKLKIKPLVGALVGSILSVLSMMIAVRRRDDGKLTGFLSFLGWLSFISSRVLVFSLVATVIHSWIVVICLIHILVFSVWIYNIAIDSYDDPSSSDTNNSRSFSSRKRISIAILVFFFFGVPSLFIWPIMFQLKEGKRPLIFLLICTIENLLLLGVWLIWLMSNQDSRFSDSLVLFIIGIVTATLTGDFLLMMYVFCKPKLTDRLVLLEIEQSAHPDMDSSDSNSRVSNAFQYGVFYAFCDIVFKLPATQEIACMRERLKDATIEFN